MSDIKIFKLNGEKVNENEGTSADIAKPLQTLIENHLETFFMTLFLDFGIGGHWLMLQEPIRFREAAKKISVG